MPVSADDQTIALLRREHIDRPILISIVEHHKLSGMMDILVLLYIMGENSP